MEQQARVLRSLLTQLYRQEDEDQQAENSISGEFTRLKSLSIKYRNDKTFPTKTADKQENIKKNRYKDIVPFDHTRVKLSLTATKNDTDYINANFIKGVSGSRAYIATQGPLPHTVVDFLRMLWEYNVGVVVMACREFEMGKKKCELYWPQKQEKPFTCEPFTVYCDSEENKGDYLIRTLRMTYRNCSRTVQQLHYVNWPDHGVPDSIPPILDLLHDLRGFQPHDDVPVCIHCSAGCGRTGALCVIDYTWNLLKKQMITSDFDIFNLVQDMRTQRPSLVQTKEQYELVYRTIRFLFQKYLHSAEAEVAQREVTHPSISEPGEVDLTPQRLLDEQRDVLRGLAPTSEPPPPAREGDTKTETRHFRTFPEAEAATRDLNEGPEASPEMRENGQNVEKEALPSPSPPSPAVVEALCLMVEDPYFDPPLGVLPPSDQTDPTREAPRWTYSPVFSTPSITLNDRALELGSSGFDEEEEEAPPPLPERTPESYLLPEDAEPADEMLTVVIPPNAAAEAIRELGGCPSPVPSLPERTPESYQLAADQAPREAGSEAAPRVNLSVIGVSSEWSGDASPGANELQSEGKTFVRSKSLKAKMTFTAPIQRLDLTSNMISNLHRRPLHVLPPKNPPHGEDVPTPPLPDRTPESFIFATDTQIFASASRAGMSSEWDGAGQPKFSEGITSRSKSVRVKSSREEPLSAARPVLPLPVVLPSGGGENKVDGNSRSSSKSEMTEKSNEKVMSRTRSLKIFKHKPKPPTAPPPPPTQPGAPPPPHISLSLPFKLGFGNRFRKPKGPRTYPETWV